MNRTNLATPLLSAEKADYCNIIKTINENKYNYKLCLITLTDLGIIRFIKDFPKR